MSSLPEWDDLIAGKGCPFCQPQAESNEFEVKVASLRLSTLCVIRNQLYHGYCVLKFNKRHVTGIEQLTEEEYNLFMQDLRQAAAAITKAVTPDHMNYVTLGNIIPHLHYHIIPRYKTDPRWRAPIWTTDVKEMTTKLLDEKGYQELVAGIRKFL
jgi:diadenosine tetraphosphate (Ap4A) HIT family hydrolase